MSMNEFRLLAMGAGCSALFAVLFYSIVNVFKNYSIVFRVVSKEKLEKEHKLDGYDRFVSENAVHIAEEKAHKQIYDIGKWKKLYEDLSHELYVEKKIKEAKKEEKIAKASKKSETDCHKLMQQSELNLRKAMELYYKDKSLSVRAIAKKFGLHNTNKIYSITSKRYAPRKILAKYSDKYDMPALRKIYQDMISKGYDIDEAAESVVEKMGDRQYIAARSIVRAFYRNEYIVN